jgi:hypothetical protein
MDEGLDIWKEDACRNTALHWAKGGSKQVLDFLLQDKDDSYWWGHLISPAVKAGRGRQYNFLWRREKSIGSAT